jgi:hypothetical protein
LADEARWTPWHDGMGKWALVSRLFVREVRVKLGTVEKS